MIVVQVAVESLYLTDDTNHAVFPNNNGEFASYQLSDGGHYEVHGDGTSTMEETLPNSTSSRNPSFASPLPTFSFAQRSSAYSASSTSVKRPSIKTFQRLVAAIIELSSCEYEQDDKD